MSHEDAHDHYRAKLAALQLALVRTQAAAIRKGRRAVVVMEGRDGAGKDGAISRIVQHLSTRATRVVALPKPTDRQGSQWWFQRYVEQLPSAGELVIFNRSWYNRAGVETVMKFSTPEEQTQFLRDAPTFEAMLVESGIKLVKYYLDITYEEEAKRLKSRQSDPLKMLKVSDLDEVALAKWSEYSEARNAMLLRTSTPLAPWTCICTDDKKTARLNIMAHLLHALAPDDIAKDVPTPDPKVAFSFEKAAIEDGRLSP